MRTNRLSLILLTSCLVSVCSPSVWAADAAATIDLGNVPRNYILASGEAVFFRTLGIDDHAVLAYEAYNASTTPWTKVESFTGIAGSYRGGERFIAAESMAKLTAGTWVLRVYQVGKDVQSQRALAIGRALSDDLQKELERIESQSPVTNDPLPEPAAPADPAPAPDPEPTEPEAPVVPEVPVVPETPEETPQSPETPAPEPTPEPEPQPEPPSDPGPIGKGFTDWKTSSDSKVIYVPSGGSIKSGYDQLRDGYPDHLVLQAGGSYSLGSGLRWAKSGRSPDQPIVVRVIGDGSRPVIHATGSAIAFSGTVKNTAFSGLHLTADTRNPDHSSYSSDCARYDGFSLYQPAINLTIEDCLVEYFTHGILLEGGNDVNVKVHRTIIRHSWSQSSKGHAQGLYALKATNLYVTECVFDQNGWEPRASGGGRTIFNHNIYAIGTKNFVVDSSIFSRGSSYGINLRTGAHAGEDQVNVTVSNSIFVDNVNTIAAGGKVPEIVSKNLKIVDSVFTRHGAVLNGAAQSLGINGFCWDGIEVARNFFIDKPFGGTSFAVKFEPGKGPVRNGKIYSNVIQSWTCGETPIQPNGSNMSSYGNFVEQSLSIYASAPRTIDTYLKSVGKSGGTTGYIEWAASRGRGVWDSRPFDFADYVADGYDPKF